MRTGTGNSDKRTVLNPDHITGIVLAGGRGSRMGGVDKGLVSLNGRPMIEHVIARLRSQVSEILISANRNKERYNQLGYRVVADVYPGYFGPLAGMMSAAQTMNTCYAVTVPCDAPLVTDTIVARLATTMENESSDLAVAHDGERTQQAFLMFKKTVVPDLAAFLLDGGRGIEVWLTRHRVAVADFSDCSDAFTNVNDPLERAALEARLRHQQSTC